MASFGRTSRHMLQSMSSGAHWKRLVQLLVLSLVVVFSSLGGRHVFVQYLTYVPEGVVLWGEDLSGMTRAAAQDQVANMVNQWMQKEISLDVAREGHEATMIQLPVADLGFSYDVEATVDAFLRSSELSADLLGADVSPLARPVVNLSDDVIEEIVDQLVSYEEASRDAVLVLDEERVEWTLVPHQWGYGLSEAEQDHVAEQLLQVALAGQEGSVDIVLEQLEPEVLGDDLQGLYAEIQLLLAKTVRWGVDGQEVSFSLRDHPWIIEVDAEEGLVYLSADALAQYVDEWAETFDLEPSQVTVSEPQAKEVDNKGEYLQAEWGGEFAHGRTLDRAAFQQVLLEALDGEASDVSIDLPYERVAPEVTIWDGQQLSLLSQGRSSYALAHGEDRLFNVEFGLNKYDGVVIPQGAEFSYNQILGWVTYDAGWKPALAIFGGGGVKPVPGGGLCQVSTTVFRAAVHEGLPITDRKPHSLDVSYYHAYGYGIDSTIYPPADIDLKFVNDTPGPIVIRTFIDKYEQEAFVEFYGLDDGREVSIEQVENREVNLPKQVIYTDEITKGYQEVLNKGRTGRYIEWAQEIIRADGSVEERAIETLYPAAARKVRVGTGA